GTPRGGPGAWPRPARPPRRSRNARAGVSAGPRPQSPATWTTSSGGPSRDHPGVCHAGLLRLAGARETGGEEPLERPDVGRAAPFVLEVLRHVVLREQRPAGVVADHRVEVVRIGRVVRVLLGH